MGEQPLYRLQLDRDGRRRDIRSRRRDIRHSRCHLAPDHARPSPILRQRQTGADPRRGLGAGHVPARRSQTHGCRIRLRPQSRTQHDPPGRQTRKPALLRSGRSPRHHDPARLGMLRQMGSVVGNRRCAVGRGGHESGRRIDGERSAAVAQSSVGDRIPDRQRQRAAEVDREKVYRRPAVEAGWQTPVVAAASKTRSHRCADHHRRGSRRSEVGRHGRRRGRVSVRH